MPNGTEADPEHAERANHDDLNNHDEDKGDKSFETSMYTTRETVCM